MGPTAANAESQRGRAVRLGVAPGTLVQSLNEDDDIARDLLDDIVATSGTELVPEDSDDVVDVVLLWWREDDGDLIDALVDARRQLSDTGVIWLLTPKAGREGHVAPSDVLEAVPTAGLVQTSTVSAAREWTGMRLGAPKSQRARNR
ncbi:MAG TPA: DUF3052 domain-containing protein [Frankiaceae bacterium]|nr:DUF3052 domain-containing protein [Frankiaceae bacterium]